MNIEKIVEEVKKGNLVITPTDTVYGIMADANNINAINKVYEAKNRDYSKPLILLASNIEMVNKYIKHSNTLEKELMNKYWPGKLTIILKKNDLVSNLITAGSEYVGIRIPDNKELLKIIDLIGNPVISTSANISSKETITSVDKIESDLLKYISYIEDGGYINKSSSTIIKVVDNKIEFLRDGELKSIIEKEFM